jgi:hypothetical protein
MGQFKTTIRLSWDDLDLLTAYQTAKDIPVRTEAIMRAVKEACVREKITIAMLPENMRASYYLAAENLAIKTPIKEEGKEEKKDPYEDPYEWLCSETNRMGDYQRCQRRIKASVCILLTACKRIPKSQWSNVFPGEELGEEDAKEERFDPEDVKEVEKLAKEGLSFEEIAEKIDMYELDLKELVKAHDITIEEPKKEPVATAPTVQKEPEKKPITQKTTSFPEKPSTAIAPPKPQEPSVDQPGMKVSKTDVDPDIEVQPAAIIKTLRERAVSKPKTRGQQTLGDDNP